MGKKNILNENNFYIFLKLKQNKIIDKLEYLNYVEFKMQKI